MNKPPMQDCKVKYCRLFDFLTIAFRDTQMAYENLMVFTGSANPELAQGVVEKLGIPLGKANVSKFSDGEVMVEINENVRGKDVFVHISAVEKAGLAKAVVIPRIGKLFLDFGLHAPTVAFPEVLGLMVEPTESYSKAELDDFLELLTTIHKIVHETPEVLATVPHFTPIDRVEEVAANKNLTLSEKLTSSLIPVLPNRVPASELTSLPKAELWKRIVAAHEKAKSKVHA